MPSGSGEYLTPFEVVQFYTEAFKVNPNYAPAHFNLGLLLRAAGDTAGAQQELATAQRLDPKLVPPTPSATPQRQVSPTPTGR